MPGKPIIVALDYPDATSALEFVDNLSPELCRLKVGFELFVAAGPEFVDRLVAKGYDVFLDLKFHDIPNTVAAACKVAADSGVWMLNVHASGGAGMLSAAREAVASAGQSRPLLIAVTVLTALSGEDLGELGIKENPAEHVLRLARLSHACGLDGVVCSAAEAATLRAFFPAQDFVLVTPGIRLAADSRDDQKRVLTPRQALESGSDYLVIGRPITRAADPVERLHEIMASLK